MNPSPNPSGQHGDPSWVTDNWDHAATPHSGATYHHQGGAAAARPEWDWESQMLLVHHQNHPGGGAATAELVGGAGDGERKPQLLALPTATALCNARQYNVAANYSATALAHHHHPGLSIAASYSAGPGLRSYAGGLSDGYHQQSQSHHHHQAAQNLQQQQQATGFYAHGSACPPSDLNAELRSYDQRRRFLGMQMLESAEHKNMLDFVKREDMYSLEPHARIGLNLGGRTYFSAEDSARLGKRSRMNALGTHAPMCQVQGCAADLSKAKHYHRRHKVCEIHSKAPNVIANAQTQRFCQQCSRFHPLSEFDDTKRSCRKRLADHNRRRRKPQHSAVATISSEPFKSEEQSTNIRTIIEGDHKPTMLLHHKSNSPTASLTDRDSLSSGGANRLQGHQQQQSPSFGTMDEKLAAANSRSSLMRSAQAGQQAATPLPSSDVQALVLSVVSRTPSSAQSTRQSPGTQESVYQQYLQGPSLSLSSAGIGSSAHQQSSPVASYSSSAMVEQQHHHSVPWLARPLQTFTPPPPAPPPSRESIDQTSSLQMNSSPQQQQFVLARSEQQLGRLGLNQSMQSSAALNHPGTQHQLLALIENNPIHSSGNNPAHPQQLTSSVDADVKPVLAAAALQHHHHRGHGHSEILRARSSSFGSSFYDSSSGIG
ncbi:uncharacterized protein LOC9659205 [Selaginella moellendorffii]|uniref:uncharacterized protein LOC9659205 n=1 Tax=Selaginella moellendorffii TaxID=88036 RepID=UPI000D1C73E0|nr:uncharacterized protein LOC9659205 [Selaginella moellendorffii]|eukprot:XP_002969457.2 uncharacterized protein LOC9659205 [Selaginella moellendorffii]